MEDLINRTELLKHSHRVTEYDEAGFSMEYNAVPTEEIKNAPAVDAVEVVRCKDCKRFEPIVYSSGSTGRGRCEIDDTGNSYKETDFCSYGERK